MRWFVLAALVSLYPSCKLTSASEGRLAAIDSNVKSLRPLAGRQDEMPYTAYFQQAELQLIDEQPADNTPVHHRYYFHQGALFYYRELDKGRVSRQFVIDKDGQVKNTIPTAFPPQEYTQITSRAEALKNAANFRAGQIFDFPIMRTR